MDIAIKGLIKDCHDLQHREKQAETEKNINKFKTNKRKIYDNTKNRFKRFRGS